MAAVQWCLSAAARWMFDGVSYLIPRLSRLPNFSGTIFSFFSVTEESLISLLRWPDGFRPSFEIVDDVYWSVVTVFESIALVSMLCCFFIFCGCTL